MEIITSRRNALAVHLKKLGTSREYRYERGEFLCDGIRLLSEAVAGGCAVTAVFVSSEEKDLKLPGNLPIYVATPDVMQRISPLKTAQEVIFACKMPQMCEIDITAQNIVLDGMQDPGNVGTSIRAASAFGIGSVLLTGACADLYNPKTVRATMGAVFRQNVAAVGYSELKSLVDSGMRIYGASLGGNSVDVRSAELRGVSVAIGSEGAGLSEEVLALCEGTVIIPMEPDTESLNAGVAASIIMWEMYRGNRNVNG